MPPLSKHTTTAGKPAAYQPAKGPFFQPGNARGTIIQRQTAGSAPAVTPRGPNPAECMTTLCTRLDPSSPACLQNPQQCAQNWVSDVMSCLTGGATASNASHQQEILDNTRQELNAQVTYMSSIQPVATASDKRSYVDWLKRFCRTKQREIGLEFHYNLVFENLPTPSGNQTYWADAASDWDEVAASLAAIPDEHLWGRPATLPLVRMRREVSHPANTPGNAVGGETDPGTGLVRIFNAGMGAAPYSRSQTLGIPATYQTIRHEVGHLVEATVPQAEMDRFFDTIVKWRQYSWAWIINHPSPYESWRQERGSLCRALGFLRADKSCDHDRVTAFLQNIDTAGATTLGGIRYERSSNFLVSWPVGNVPTGLEFSYARTGKTDYFAELYTLALSTPEFLHRQLPDAQLQWLKQQLFNTQAHYTELIAPYEPLAFNGPEALTARYLGLLQLARAQFTRQQLQSIAAQLQAIIQQSSLPGGSTIT